MLISFLIPAILFEYGGKRNSHHIKKTVEQHTSQ